MVRLFQLIGNEIVQYIRQQVANVRVWASPFTKVRSHCTAVHGICVTVNPSCVRQFRETATLCMRICDQWLDTTASLTGKPIASFRSDLIRVSAVTLIIIAGLIQSTSGLTGGRGLALRIPVLSCFD